MDVRALLIPGILQVSLKNIVYIYLFTANGLSPAGRGYFTYKQNMKLVTNKSKPGGLNEKHVVTTWNLGNHLSIRFWAQE